MVDENLVIETGITDKDMLLEYKMADEGLVIESGLTNEGMLLH